ncbi:chordin-like protein 1 [Anneissia japonica]|uniref:chordin-like protein 1 n=1 Tax=Anneissia japonica TaxID=1529436 RepID=UPI00142565F5|nr:chordin-like protein 1 [Anneissia japonica]
MDRQSYSVGSSWHPYFIQSGYDYCTLCTCLHHDDPSCASIQCPVVTCDRTKTIPGQCCKQCTDSEENSTIGGLHTTIQPSETYCHYGGESYRQGESFTLEKVNSVRPNQCTQCACMDDKIQCALRTCIPVPCSQPVLLPTSCCPICPGKETTDNQQHNEHHETTMGKEVATAITITRQKIESGAGSKTHPTIPIEDIPEEDRPMNASGGSCQTDYGVYIHGQRWHPNVYPFGVMKCIVCSCLNGKWNCSKVVCIDEELKCSNPVMVAGQCCPTCPEDNKVPYANKPTIIAEPPMCLQPRENVVVYSTPSDNEKRSTAKGQQVSYVIERLDEKTMELHQWILNSNGSIRNFGIFNISLKEFAELLTSYPDRHTIEGATTSHKLRKLLNKEQKIYKNCEVNCRRQVRKITKILKLRKVTRQEHCPYSKTNARRIRKSKGRRG